jgi:uncharacterized protein (DUF1330 family)
MPGELPPYHLWSVVTIFAKDVSMPAYLIADIHVRDTALYEEYRRLAMPVIAAHGGKYLAKGTCRFEVLEGAWTPRRLVVLEFETAEQARRWYESSDYRKVRDLRQRSASTNMVMITSPE